jgi:hypothetical protein
MAWVRRALGFAIAFGAFWLACFGHVDTDAPSGRSNCGPNLFKVLVNGPSKNKDILTLGACRSNAISNLVICGILLAVGVAVACGAYGRLTRRFAPPIAPSPGAVVVPIQRFRINWRAPFVEVTPDEVRIVMPRFFGSRPWVVPVCDVVTTDLSINDPGSDGGLDDVVFERPVSVPYLFTTSYLRPPNLVLLFHEPQRVPPLRWSAYQDPNLDLPFTRRESRSVDGAHLDGIALRTPDTAAALEAFRGAGVEVTSSAAHWLVGHRTVSRDPADLEVARIELGRLKWLDRIGMGVPALLVVSVALITKLDEQRADQLVPVLLVPAGLLFGAHQFYVRIILRRRAP